MRNKQLELLTLQGHRCLWSYSDQLWVSDRVRTIDHVIFLTKIVLDSPVNLVRMFPSYFMFMFPGMCVATAVVKTFYWSFCTDLRDLSEVNSFIVSQYWPHHGLKYQYRKWKVQYLTITTNIIYFIILVINNGSPSHFLFFLLCKEKGF